MAAALTWAAATGKVHALEFALFGFRAEASAVLAPWSSSADDARLGRLVLLALVSGIASLAVVLALVAPRYLRRHSPLALAVGAAAAVELAGVALGGSYWSHYLIGLAPMLALAAGVAATDRGSGRRLVRALVVVPVAIALGASPANALMHARALDPVGITADWVADSARPTDSLVVLYSHANVLEASGLRPGYPYAWSLPLRILDPHLRLLEARLTSAHHAPTWVVAWDDLQGWGLDANHRVEADLEAHYVEVADVCGHPIWLHRGLSRPGGSDACTGQ
jgi:hypothetical protein